MKKAKQTEFKFERALERIEEIVERMESGEIELDQALELYKEGNDLMAQCQAALQDVRKNIKKLTKDGQGQLKLEENEMEE
ncbi:MAG: exodeoxyribonuclease VII small subunit [Candidatus Edwardsbacteria bacterium]|nr:exodeoxyribonuclease VII small subunit [Candidatus Edwardsbacteria bacterium]